MIGPDDLRAFMKSFYGYGRYNADYWFVGLEEGGASSISDLAKRVETWRALGSHEVEDLYAFHFALGYTGWFGQEAKRQHTWSRLIQIALIAERRPCTSATIRRYQAEHLGRADGETFLGELMPLPAKNVRAWYANSLNLPELRSRADYTRAIRAERIAHLKQRIAEKQPRVVVFYGARRYWPSLLGIEFQNAASFDRAVFGRTTVLVTHHPASRQARRNDFDEAGEAIARQAFASRFAPIL